MNPVENFVRVETNFDPFVALVIGLPLLTAFVLLFFGRRFTPEAPRNPRELLPGILASAAMAGAFVAGVLMFMQLVELAVHGHEENSRAVGVHFWDWIRAGGFSVGMDFLVDQLSIVMVLVVTGVGTLIHIYSIGYMREDPRFARYFAYLNLFAASMLILVLADNLVLLYVGWEGVGLCSYLLIGFWFERDSAANAAKKAFLVNRVGDFSFLIGIFVLASAVGGLSIGQINAEAGAIGSGIALIAALLLFGGATGKSAQIPLYIWLPDAMEGPTPVSALIHAATMVTAGVYMVARMSPLFEASDALIVVGWIGALTALWAALMAATEYDIKRVLAYSTVSQLGYMFLAHGVGAYSAGIFHLVTHAFFKALLFLGAGAVMHALAGETDMRKMGGLRKKMPITGWTFMAGWLAICGVIPFAGFFSKDAILASAWHEGEYVLWAIGVGTAFLTAFYMSRLYFRVFEGRSAVSSEVHLHDAPPTMAAALIPLAVLAVIGGALNLPGFLTLEHFLEPALGEAGVPEGLTPWILGGVALLVAFAGIAVARGLYLTRSGSVRRRRIYSRTSPLINAARDKFYVDEIYGRTMVLPGKALARFASDRVDAGWIDGIVNGTGSFIAERGEGMRRFQTGYVRSYAAIFLFGVVITVTVLLLRTAY
jgi:NADH-quinone oxidoreductase subunit L